MESQTVDALARTMVDHQLAADINLPCSPDLLKQVLPKSQLMAIYEKIGREELERIAAVEHGKKPNTGCNALAEREEKDLRVLCMAIFEVTGKTPWIIGFASNFACGLLTCISNK